MNKTKRLVALMSALQLVLSIPVFTANAEENNNSNQSQKMLDAFKNSIEYLKNDLETEKSWISNNFDYTADVANSIEFVYNNILDLSNDQYDSAIDLVEQATDIIVDNDISNNDDLSRYLLVSELQNPNEIEWLLSSQNPDGGFGLAEGYASDIIDTKLALKALEDIGETDSMTGAACYIASLQNDDGGFGYQSGLDSDPALSADIADILIDCAKDDIYLSYALAGTISKLDTYLDTTAISIEDLSADDMEGVYQHFHTALFDLKKDGKYNVAPYYELQAEDGGVFDDPMATALYLELIVREQNTLVAGIDAINITNDKGYAVAAYNSNENVNISIENDFETEKAYFKAEIIAPDGTSIPLSGDTAVWNTADSEEGTYTVKAQILRKANDDVAVSAERTFRIQHRLAIDSVELVLSQGYSKKGDDDTVAVNAEIGLRNFSEESNISVHWTVTTDGTVISDETKALTDADMAAELVELGEFIPDTSERRVYTISAEIVSGDLTLAQSSTNYFISDKSVALTYATDKDYLYETEDDAEVTISLRDERVVDLVFTTASEDMALVSDYSAKIEAIKERLERLGYVVNLSNVSTSYLSAKDTFAWTEYDHINYKDRYCADIPKHIVYEENDIVMKGYGYSPLKDFLFVDDDKVSKKILEFDLQRDRSNDWHTLDGGGFLFNTSIVDGTLKGYCLLVNRDGLNLYQIKGVDLEKFRNGSYNYVSSCATRLQHFAVTDLLAKHHIKIVADNKTLSLWNDDTQLLDEYELPVNDLGNGYGPITSYTSHACSVRSSFTFSNITMKTIAGEKLTDILNNYNFESDDSRYVICLSDTPMDGIDTDEQYEDVADKIKERKICFIGLGNDTSMEQYEKISELAPANTLKYMYEDDATAGSVSDHITDTEEAKRIKNEDSVIATDLRVTGILPDGTLLAEEFDVLYEGETLSFTVPVELEKLTAGTDAILIENVTLDYKDENGIPRTKNAGDITLPVVSPEGKIVNGVSTDKPEYLPYEDVEIFDRIKNTSAVRSAKDLTNIITIIDEGGNEVARFTKDLPEIMTVDYTERIEKWNTAENAAGTYTVISQVFEGSLKLAESSAQFVLGSDKVITLDGALNIEGMLFKVEDTIPMNYNVTNTSHYDVEDGVLAIRVVDPSSEETVYEYTAPLDLASGASYSSSLSVVPADDFSSRKNNEYIVIYEAVTSDGQIIPLSGDGFMLDVMDLSMLCDDVLFAMNKDSSKNGISMSGWKMLVEGSVHSNAGLTANCSIFEVTNGCTSLNDPVFNTWQTILGVESRLTDPIELPDIMRLIRRRLLYAPYEIKGGEIHEDADTVRIYGNSSSVDEDIYSEKNIVIIDPENFSSNTEEGILICSEGDVTIRSTDVNFKGIIYAPNGTVRIEANNFNLQGRIIADNIVYQGSCFTGAAYEGDLALLTK